MIDLGIHSVCGVSVSAVDYDAAVAKIMHAARRKRRFSVSALAVHGVMTGFTDPEHRSRLNSLDLVVPDGQPVRWALRLLHGCRLDNRVYGPELTLRVCAAAEEAGLPVLFYGSKPETLAALAENLGRAFPKLRIVGLMPSRFRTLTEAENEEVLDEIRATGAGLVFVGLGCPRQEVWVYENASALSCPVLAVGAAFDFHAGLLKQAPPWMQDRGLEWLYRLSREPRRLWRRYAYLNPLFCYAVARQYFAAASRSNDAVDHGSTPERIRYG